MSEVTPPPRRRLTGTAGDDRGASFVELGALTMLTATIVIAVAQSNAQQMLNDTVREMVCLVEGPECGGETWTEHDRPKKPETYRFGTGNVGGDNEENKALGKELAAARGFDGGEWECLEQLWHNESNWDHTATNPNGGAHGIPQLHPEAHTPPPGYRNNAEVQIEWGLDYIERRYQTPCAAWAFWQDPSPKRPEYSDNWY